MLLPELAERATGCNGLRVQRQAVRKLAVQVMNPTTAGLWRFTGRGVSRRGRPVDWSLIVKLVQAAGPGTRSLRDWNYWKRELLVYRSGLLAELTGWLRGPRVVEVRELSRRRGVICLEEVREVGPRAWPLSRYAQAARHLGQFNGRFLGARPGYEWLCRGWLRRFVRRVSASWPLLERNSFWRAPALRVFSPAFQARVLAVHAAAPRLLDLLAELPQVVSHFDASRSNLLSSQLGGNRPCTVAIDWQLIGTGAVGEELAALVSGALVFGLEVPPASAVALQEAVLDGYLAGLRATGWQGERRAVELGYAAHTLLRVCGMLPYLLSLVRQRALRRQWEAKYQVPLDRGLARWAAGIQALVAQVWALVRTRAGLPG